MQKLHCVIILFIVMLIPNLSYSANPRGTLPRENIPEMDLLTAHNLLSRALSVIYEEFQIKSFELSDKFLDDIAIASACIRSFESQVSREDYPKIFEGQPEEYTAAAKSEDVGKSVAYMFGRNAPMSGKDGQWIYFSTGCDTSSGFLKLDWRDIKMRQHSIYTDISGGIYEDEDKDKGKKVGEISIKVHRDVTSPFGFIIDNMHTIMYK